MTTLKMPGNANQMMFGDTGLLNGQVTQPTPVGGGSLSDILGQLGGGQQTPSSTGFGFNMPTAQLGLAGLQSIAGLYTGMQGLNLAKKQFDFSSGLANTNLNNQIKSYNTGLEDRSRNRANVEGQSPETAAEYVARNRLTR